MKVEELAFSILSGGNIQDKLLKPDEVRFDSKSQSYAHDADRKPARNFSIQFSEKRSRFPKRGSLEVLENRAKTLHFFANHELLAIEFMAWAILEFSYDKNFQKKVYATLVDEQKHLELYINRIQDMGIEFGDFPLNDFFWRQVKSIESVEHYLCSMSLCFEMANLDFASEYADIFRQFDDNASSQIMEEVLKDEIRHVAIGWNGLKTIVGRDSVWEYFIENLPMPLTPQRSKGVVFNRNARERAGVSHQFIENLMRFNDDYAITQRRQWKQNQHSTN